MFPIQIASYFSLLTGAKQQYNEHKEQQEKEEKQQKAESFIIENWIPFAVIGISIIIYGYKKWL